MMLQNYHIWQYHASFLGEIYPKMPGFRPKIIFFGRNLPQNAEISPDKTSLCNTLHTPKEYPSSL